ncbi:MAG TPA: TolC family protein [Candidatus Binataceae bacterium]|nr:TolC family protein [Candidatus Binataceae bacterium]
MKITVRWHLALSLIGVVSMAATGRAHAAPLTLSEAIDRAIAFAPSVSMAAADSDVSGARARETRAPLYPALSAGSEYYQAPGYNTTVTNRGVSAGLVALNYTMWDWGRREASYRAARYVSEAAQFGIAAARAQIAFDASLSYYDLMHARASERELTLNLQRLSRYVATVEALQASGRAISNDVLKIRSARDSAELMLSAAHHETLMATADLGAMMGDFSAADIEVVNLTDIPDLPAGDITRSPAMEAATRAVSSAEQQIKEARAERLPTFQIALTTGALGIDPPNTVNNNWGASYDGVISMPLFDGGAISSRIDRAKAKLNSASAQYRETSYLLERRLKDASIRYQEAVQALTILARSQPTADDAFALSWTRFLGGGGATILEVLDSYQQAEQLRIERLNHDLAALQAVATTILLYGRIR